MLDHDGSDRVFFYSRTPLGTGGSGRFNEVDDVAEEVFVLPADPPEDDDAAELRSLFECVSDIRYVVANGDAFNNGISVY